MSIRQLVPHDVPECVVLGVEAFRTVYTSCEQAFGTDLVNRFIPDWEAAQAAQIESLCTSADGRSFVAVEWDAVVGFLVARPNDATGLASIVTIAVHPDSQRRGIGSQLVEESLGEMRRLGMAYVQAYIRGFAGHRPARIAFGRAGFESMNA